MNISQRVKSDIVILDIEGEVDIYHSYELKNQAQSLIDNSKIKIIFNLENVSYIDSSGIGALIFILSNIKKVNGSMCFIKPSATVIKVLELTKLTSFFILYPSEEDAIKALS